MKPDPTGPEAAKIRQAKFQIARRLRIPVDALPGSLSLTHSRCGKPSCHCAKGEGHPVWSLTFMDDGKKRVERIPEEWVEEVRQRVEAGRAFRDSIAKVFVANANLLVLRRLQAREQRRRKRKG